jgi:hypothetical protein
MTIALTATREAAGKPGTHGGFSGSAVKFSLTQGQRPGFVIQHVIRSFEVYRLTDGTPSGTKMTATEIDKYIGSVKAYPAITEYWEAWPFDKGDESDTDNFSLTDFSSKIIVGTYKANGTVGTFTQQGQMIFYASSTPATTLANLGFAKNRTIANGLLYTETKPDDTKLPTTTSGTADRETKVTWDDRTGDYKTDIRIDDPK